MDARGLWVRDTLAPEVVAKNWPRASLIDADLGCKSGGNAADGGFASVTYTLALRVEHPAASADDGPQEKEQQTHHLLVKVFPEEPSLREMHNSDMQFANEDLMYRAVLPALESLDCSVARTLWPRCLLSRRYSSQLAVLVMEDLSKLGFRLAQPAAALDNAHATLALQRLARLHALAYVYQARQPQQYQGHVKQLKETYYVASNAAKQNVLMRLTVERGIGPLRSRPECADLVAALDRHLTDPFGVIVKLLAPSKPATDVLCHGDFCRNNILFKYDEHGQPCDLRLIDFATVRESSPASDIAHFLFLSVSEEARRGTGLTRLLRSYHEALTTTLGTLQVADPWQGQLDALLHEVGRQALFAYVICSFFLPVMVADPSSFQVEDLVTMTEEQKNEMNLALGGEAATARLTAILLEFQQHGFHHMWQ